MDAQPGPLDRLVRGIPTRLPTRQLELSVDFLPQPI